MQAKLSEGEEFRVFEALRYGTAPRQRVCGIE